MWTSMGIVLLTYWKLNSITIGINLEVIVNIIELIVRDWGIPNSQ